MRTTRHCERMHVMLVEDNPGDALLIQEAFLESGSACRITVVNDGEWALAMFHEERNEPTKFRPDLILLDLNLPGMNGLEVLKVVKSRDDTRTIPVFVLTSSRAPRDISTANELCCNAYFCKPSTFSEYVQLASDMTDLRHLDLEYPPLVAHVEKMTIEVPDSSRAIVPSRNEARM